MDVIAWGVGLIAGLTQPTLKRSVVIGVTASIALRLYQLVFGHWGDDLPADLIGALAMVVVTILFTWIGWLIRSARIRRAGAMS